MCLHNEWSPNKYTDLIDVNYVVFIVVEIFSKYVVAHIYLVNFINLWLHLLYHLGGLSVAVPGELRGYWVAHQRYGKLPWEKLVQPTIELCKNGHVVTPFLAKFFKSQEATILNSPTLR